MSGTLVKVLVGVVGVAAIGGATLLVAKKKMDVYANEVSDKVKEQLEQEAVEEAVEQTGCKPEDVSEEQIQAFVNDHHRECCVMIAQDKIVEDVKKIVNHPAAKVVSMALTVGPIAWKLYKKFVLEPQKAHAAEGELIRQAYENAIEVEEVNLADGTTQYVTDDGVIVTEF